MPRNLRALSNAHSLLLATFSRWRYFRSTLAGGVTSRIFSRNSRSELTGAYGARLCRASSSSNILDSLHEFLYQCLALRHCTTRGRERLSPQAVKVTRNLVGNWT